MFMRGYNVVIFSRGEVFLLSRCSLDRFTIVVQECNWCKGGVY